MFIKRTGPKKPHFSREKRISGAFEVGGFLVPGRTACSGEVGEPSGWQLPGKSERTKDIQPVLCFSLRHSCFARSVLCLCPSLSVPCSCVVVFAFPAFLRFLPAPRILSFPALPERRMACFPRLSLIVRPFHQPT